MGCGASTRRIEIQDPLYVEVNEVWDRAWKFVETKTKTKNVKKNLVVKRSGWKSIRIFVSSTFRDFHQEREVLVKKVFPDLRVWCEAHRLQLVECDLRWLDKANNRFEGACGSDFIGNGFGASNWLIEIQKPLYVEVNEVWDRAWKFFENKKKSKNGVPKESNSEATLRACLGEIDRCYQDNFMPFFVNMTSERIGWIPLGEEIPDALREQYKWVEGLSVTEMEIMHGAYRKDNPNALFLLRDPSFLSQVPEEYKKSFVDSQPIAAYKLDMLKKMIKDRFKMDEVMAHCAKVVTYKVDYLGFNPDTNTMELGGLDGTFSKMVFDFFKNQIEAQYPLPEGKLDPYQQVAEQHESFMKNRCLSVLGRDDILKKIDDYICGIGSDVPLMLFGGAGTGKSSIMAKVADDILTKALNKDIPGGGDKGWHVFYHFVGAVPGSTELEAMLKRLLREIEVCNDSNMPKDLNDAAQTTCGALNNPTTHPVIIIVDAMNQFDEDQCALLVNWVPRKLAPQIRCVFSMIPDTPQYKVLTKREPLPTLLEVTPLDEASRKSIVEDMLGKYNKRLDEGQLESLLSKTSSENPLWLSIACEELRVFGKFRQLNDKINQLQDGLLELEVQVLERFERENGGDLLVAAVCLLEVSASGLLEVELLRILADEDNLMPKINNKDEGSEKEDKGSEKKKEEFGHLPAFKWAEVYRALKPFVRPFGDSGEGRLDFYHRSFSKAVRRKYFMDQDGKPRAEQYLWWHRKLADFFERSKNLARKIEEYPVHLSATADTVRLEKFLTEWTVFDELFDEEYSSRLVTLWRKGPGFERMEQCYTDAVTNIANTSDTGKNHLCCLYEKVSRFFTQSGRYVKAEELLEKAVRLEKEELGERPERMGELYHLAAIVADEIMKQEEFMYRSQLPRMLGIIRNFEKSVEIRKTLPGDRNKFQMGLALNRLGFYYGGYNLRGGDGAMSAQEAQEKAKASVEEAIKIFQELKDEMHTGDSLTTKGVVYGRAIPKQIKAYKEAEEILIRVGGELHHNLDRLYLNMGIYYEECGDYYKAHEFFCKWHTLCSELYGPGHPRSFRSINTLREPMYRRISQEKGIAVPELPSAE